MLVVLSEADCYPPISLNARELHQISEAARLFGCRVYPIPLDFDICGTAEQALAYLPEFDPLVPGVWVGYIPTPERYQAIYGAALAKGVRLVNAPTEYQTAMEFDHSYALLGDLTPESMVIHSLEQCEIVEERLGYPVFVKGAVKSNKEQGWSACVAHGLAELILIAQQLLVHQARSRGRIIVRRLVQLRRSGEAPGGFPLGREYRAFVYREQLLAYGYYWDEHTDAFPFTAGDLRAITQLSLEAARRLSVPFLAVDLGQLEDGNWIVIEVGDGQFSGLSHVNLLELWSKLAQLTLERVRYAAEPPNI